MVNKIPILLSYAYANKDIMAILSDKNVYSQFDIIIDSGAFSAYNSGNVIKLSKYTEFIMALPFPVSWYFTLDVINNPRETLGNFNLMMKEGLNPVPIFTKQETKETFDYYYKCRGLIGIGALTAKDIHYLLTLYNNRIITTEKVHWLGFIQHDLLLNFKPYSCDTASWKMGSRFARGWYYYMRKYRTFSKQSYQSAELQLFCQKYNLDSKALNKESAWRWKDGIPPLSQIIQLYAALEYSMLITNKINSLFFLSMSCFTEKGFKIILDNIKIFKGLNNE